MSEIMKKDILKSSFTFIYLFFEEFLLIFNLFIYPLFNCFNTLSKQTLVKLKMKNSLKNKKK